MKFVKYVEFNDHEGETWFFFLQKDGNEEELSKFKNLLDSDFEYKEHEQYTLLDEELEEFEVDILVKHSTCGYMYLFNKVTGKFTCPTDSLELHELLYKGKIEKLFE